MARNTSPIVRAWQPHAWVRAGCGMRAPRAALPPPPPLLLLLLLGPAARGITGEILHVDGGYHAMGAPGAAAVAATTA